MDGLTFINIFSVEALQTKLTNINFDSGKNHVDFLSFLKNAFVTDGEINQGILNNIESSIITCEQAKVFTEVLLRLFSIKDILYEPAKERNNFTVEVKNDNEIESHGENEVATILLHILNAIFKKFEEHKTSDINKSNQLTEKDRSSEEKPEKNKEHISSEIILTNLTGEPTFERQNGFKTVSTNETDRSFMEKPDLQEFIVIKGSRENMYSSKNAETVKEGVKIIEGNFITETVKSEDDLHAVFLKDNTRHGNNYITSENHEEYDTFKDIDKLKTVLNDRVFKQISGEKTENYELIFRTEKFKDPDRNNKNRDIDGSNMISDRLNILDTKKYNPSEIKVIEISNTSITEALEKVEKVIKQFSQDKVTADFVIKFKIDEKDILHIALKREGTTILVNLKSTNIDTVNMFNAQKEAIIKGLVEKDINTSIYVYPDGANGQEKRHPGEDERKNDRKRKDKNEFYEVLMTQSA